MAPVCTKCDQPLDTTGEVIWATKDRKCYCMATPHPRIEWCYKCGEWLPCGMCRGLGFAGVVHQLNYQCPGCEVNGVLTAHKNVEAEYPVRQFRAMERPRYHQQMGPGHHQEMRRGCHQEMRPEFRGPPARARPSLKPSWRQRIVGWAFQTPVTPTPDPAPRMARNRPQFTPPNPRPPVPQYEGPPVSSYPRSYQRPDYQSPDYGPYQRPGQSPHQSPYPRSYPRPCQESWDSYYYPSRQGQYW